MEPTTVKLWDNAPGQLEGEEIPSITCYPANPQTTRAALVIFPGGGYAFRADHEGKGYAEWANGLGMSAFVVNYRVKPYAFPASANDARRAVRYVRAHAAEFNVDPDRICVMGSSAGGHAAAFLCTYRGPLEGEGVDAVDTYSYLPNAQILCYPVISLVEADIWHKGSVEIFMGTANLPWTVSSFSPDRIADAQTPQAFIWHTAEDGGVNVINSYRYAERLRRMNVPVEMHIFPHGGHGMGLASGMPYVARWSEMCAEWFKLIGFLPA